MLFRPWSCGCKKSQRDKQRADSIVCFADTALLCIGRHHLWNVWIKLSRRGWFLDATHHRSILNLSYLHHHFVDYIGVTLQEARMTQWWEHMPSTKVARVRFRPNVLSLLLGSGLLRGFNFSPGTPFQFPLQYISKFQIHQDRGPAWKPAKVDVTSSLNIVTFYLSYFFFIHQKLRQN